MPTPSEVLYAALGARPQQTAGELVEALAQAGHHGFGVADVEQLLDGDPRLRHDGDAPPRWRALGTGHPASLLELPTPHRPTVPVLAPAASFGERAPSRAFALPRTPGGILPAAAFGGRPSVRVQEHAAPTRLPASVASPPAAAVATRVTDPTAQPVSAPTAQPVSAPVAQPAPEPRGLPVRVPVVARASTPAAPAEPAPPVPTRTPTPPTWVPNNAVPVSTPPVWVPTSAPVSATPVSTPIAAASVAVAPVTRPAVAAAIPAPTGVAAATTVAAAPVEARPVAAAPVAARPVAAAPVAARPVPAAPVEARPVPAAPVTARPVPAAPVEARPVAAAPVEARPVAAAPVEAQPVATEPVTARPVPAAPVEARPVPAAPVTARPVPAAPVEARSVAAAPVEPRPVAAPPVAARPVPAAPPPGATAPPVVEPHRPPVVEPPPPVVAVEPTPQAAVVVDTVPAPAVVQPTPSPVIVEAAPASVIETSPPAFANVETNPPVVTAPAPTPVVEPAPPVPEVAAAPSPADREPLAPGGEVRYVGPQLRRWQKDVLDAWLATDRRGIVEAVSAQGRGVVGVLAAWDALTRGEKVLVLVPTTDLMEQWFNALEMQLPGLSLGRRGDGWVHTFDECDALVSLVSAAFGHDLLQDRAGLLIADEVHKYGSARPAETLRAGFGARLGLTSSVERLDAGVDEILRPYFGAVLDGCDLRRGRKEGVLARFRVAFVPVDLGAAEQAEHDALSARIDELSARLTLAHGCRPATFVDDVVAVQGRWQENSGAAADASAYLRAVSTRRDLLATSSAKLDALARLAPTVARSTHSVVFTHTKDGAESAATRLRTAGVATDVVHHGLETRRSSLRSFREGSLKALTTPKVLDEGLDLPPVDVVVVLAASRSARQCVQRMSPILRPTQADRLPAAIVVYARGTVEDPAEGTGEGHLDDLVEIATEVRTFDVGTPGGALAAWFVGA
ncbi:MAG: helicase-related protein [Cellulomonas sp.]